MTDITEKSEDRLLSLQGISKGGLTCTHCGCRDMRTTNTLRQDNVIVRYKRCRNCGMSFKSQEVIVD